MATATQVADALKKVAEGIGTVPLTAPNSAVEPIRVALDQVPRVMALDPGGDLIPFEDAAAVPGGLLAGRRGLTPRDRTGDAAAIPQTRIVDPTGVDLVEPSAPGETLIPLDISVDWSVTEEGEEVPTDQLVIEHISDVIADLWVVPRLIALESERADRPRSLAVSAAVTISARTDLVIELENVDVPPEIRPLDLGTVQVPLISVPTLVLMFTKPSLGEYCLICTRAAGDVDDVVDGTMRKIVTLFRTLEVFAGTPLEALVPGTETLFSVISRVAAALPVLAGGLDVPNANDIVLHGHSWWEDFFNDIEAENTISSVAVVGVPGTVARFYRDRDYKADSYGWFELQVPPTCAVMAPNLREPDKTGTASGAGDDPGPEAFPMLSDLGNLVKWVTQGHGNADSRELWDDAISSMRVEPPPDPVYTFGTPLPAV